MPFLLMYKGGCDKELNTVVKDAVSSSSIHPETEKKDDTGIQVLLATFLESIDYSFCRESH